MLNRITPWLLTITCLFPMLLIAAEEAENKTKLAWTDAAEAPEDFAWQGEFAGDVKTDDGKQAIGLQLIARGDGQFEAVSYKGGLPGDGWDGTEQTRVNSTLEDGQILFTHKETGMTATVKQDMMTIAIKNKDGKTVGTLNRVTRKSETLGAKPPEGAVVLFDGTTGENFENGRVSKEGFLMQGVTSKQTFKDCHLHVEFMLPFMPYATGQQRGNSGCYLQGRYEVQMLDSFGLAGLDNECGGIYSVKAPQVNMCLPPLTWQTYDIDFTAPVFDEDGNKTKNATLTVRHNGVLVQDHVEVEGPTRAAPFQESAEAGPLYLQDHSNPVRYRNIWLVEK
ncbi:MAG: DUF1080 domain-containing protein [Planctomycetaceae bacterium]|nr:DUF1080 domain-containing protein [Planctomycetaceae bacterium]